MKPSRHNTEQMTRGYLMYQLAKRGYNIHLTPQNFPFADMLVVSPEKRSFTIDVKGQISKNFWFFKECIPQEIHFFAFIYVPEEGTPRVFIMDSVTAMKLWHEYKAAGLARNPNTKDQFWGLNWTTPHPYEDRYDLLPK